MVPSTLCAGLRRAVFLDKDGTLIEDVPFNVNTDKICFTPGAAKGLRALRHAGFKLVVISNQPGVARGLFPEEALAKAHRHLAGMLRAVGVDLAGFYYCPHHPDAAVAAYRHVCLCRKPAPGMVLQAALDLNLDLRRSWFLGDILDDVEAGCRAGCRAILVDRGLETQWRRGAFRKPYAKAANLAAAAQLIMRANHDYNT